MFSSDDAEDADDELAHQPLPRPPPRAGRPLNERRRSQRAKSKKYKPTQRELDRMLHAWEREEQDPCVRAAFHTDEDEPENMEPTTPRPMEFDEILRRCDEILARAAAADE